MPTWCWPCRTIANIARITNACSRKPSRIPNLQPGDAEQKSEVEGMLNTVFGITRSTLRGNTIANPGGDKGLCGQPGPEPRVSPVSATDSSRAQHASELVITLTPHPSSDPITRAPEGPAII